jgi:hypothetical protein
MEQGGAGDSLDAIAAMSTYEYLGRKAEDRLRGKRTNILS